MKVKNRWFWIILVFGCFIRLFYIGNIPGNTALYNDEAVSAYDSFSLLHYGIDMNGYHNPVYLISMGDGTSILQPILLMPIIAVLGLNSFSVRILQAVLGCIVLPVVYYIAYKLSCDDKKRNTFALFAMGIFSIIPWHNLMCRWALDCNIIVPFLIISTGVLIKATEDNRFLPLAALFLGLCLYSYALPWMVMPIIAVGYVVCLLFTKKLRPNIFLLLYFLILGLFAIPLFLFIMVNSGIINEIRTSFISIPRLPQYRTDELSLNPKQIMMNLYYAMDMLVKQDDGRVSNAVPNFGLFYKFSGIPIIIGIASSIRNIVQKKANSVFYMLIMLHFIAGIMLCGILTEMAFNRANIILFPLTIFLIIGLYAIMDYFGSIGAYSVITLYLGAFLCFMAYYLTIQDDLIATAYGDGMQYCAEYIQSEERNSYPVSIISGMNYAQLLYYTAYPTDVFLDTQIYDYSDPDRPTWKTIHSFGRFSFTYGEKRLSDEATLYICGTEDVSSIDFMKDNDMEISYFSTVAVGLYNPK